MASRKELTDRQLIILRGMMDHFMAHLTWPSIRELAAVLQTPSTNNVIEHLVRMERKGLIVRTGSGKSRSNRLSSKGASIVATSLKEKLVVHLIKGLDDPG